MIGLSLEELLDDDFAKRFYLANTTESVLAPTGHKLANFVKLSVGGDELRLLISRRLLAHPVNRVWGEEIGLAFLERLQVAAPVRALTEEWSLAGPGVQVTSVVGEEWLTLTAKPPEPVKKKGLWGLLGGG